MTSLAARGGSLWAVLGLGHLVVPDMARELLFVGGRIPAVAAYGSMIGLVCVPVANHPDQEDRVRAALVRDCGLEFIVKDEFVVRLIECMFLLPGRQCDRNFVACFKFLGNRQKFGGQVEFFTGENERFDDSAIDECGCFAAIEHGHGAWKRLISAQVPVHGFGHYPGALSQPRITNLTTERPSVNDRDGGEGGSYSDHYPVGYRSKFKRRLGLAVAAFVLMWPIRFLGIRLCESGRPWVGFCVAAVGVGGFAVAEVLFVLTSYRSTWGWWL